MADEIAKGVNTLRHLPPVALVAIVAVGVGGVLYIRSRKSAPEGTSNDTPQEVDEYAAVKISPERTLTGSLPSSGAPANDQAVTAPRRDPITPPAAAPVRIPQTTRKDDTVFTVEQGLQPPKTTPASGGTGAASNPTLPVAPPDVSPVAPQSPAQTYNPITEVKVYPGYPNNFEPNRAMVQDTTFLKSWQTIKQSEDAKRGPNWNAVAEARNLSQIAIGGSNRAKYTTQTKGSAYPPVSITNTNRIRTNHVRVANGLKPLTNAEWDQAAAYMSQLWNGNEKAQIYQSGEYARLIFERYNLPYRYA